MHSLFRCFQLYAADCVLKPIVCDLNDAIFRWQLALRLMWPWMARTRVVDLMTTARIKEDVGKEDDITILVFILALVLSGEVIGSSQGKAEVLSGCALGSQRGPNGRHRHRVPASAEPSVVEKVWKSVMVACKASQLPCFPCMVSNWPKLEEFPSTSVQTRPPLIDWTPSLYIVGSRISCPEGSPRS